MKRTLDSVVSVADDCHHATKKFKPNVSSTEDTNKNTSTITEYKNESIHDFASDLNELSFVEMQKESNHLFNDTTSDDALQTSVNARNDEYNDIQWSPEQKQVIEAVKQGKNVWITGPGGTGKTFIQDYLFDMLTRKYNKRVQRTASTGIAAVSCQGITLHAFLGCGLAEEHVDTLKAKLDRRPDILKRFNELDVLMIDEVSMIVPEFFDKADQILRHARGCIVKPFGGLQLILVGDFFQLPPVKKQRKKQATSSHHPRDAKHATPRIGKTSGGLNQPVITSFYTSVKMTPSPVCQKRQESSVTAVALKPSSMNRILDQQKNQQQPPLPNHFDIPTWTLPLACIEDMDFIFELALWNELNLETIELKRVFRQDNQSFVDLLNRMRLGCLTSQDLKIIQQRIGANVSCPNGMKPMMLYALRKDVDKINHDYIRSLKGDVVEYQAKVYWEFQDESMSNDAHATKRMKQLAFQIANYSVAPSKLQLKLGAQVMLLQNLDFKCNLINGSRGVVVDFEEDEDFLPVVRFCNGITKTIRPYKWSVQDRTLGTVYFKQIPLKVGYCLTIHKSQSMTIDYAVMNLGSKVFEYGQCYVAFSRMKSLEGLSLVDFDPQVVRPHPKVVKFYQSVFQNK